MAFLQDFSHKEQAGFHPTPQLSRDIAHQRRIIVGRSGTPPSHLAQGVQQDTIPFHNYYETSPTKGYIIVERIGNPPEHLAQGVQRDTIPLHKLP
jgi:hypothetical protein